MINILGESYILATRLEVRGTAGKLNGQAVRKLSESKERKPSLSLLGQIRTLFSPRVYKTQI